MNNEVKTEAVPSTTRPRGKKLLAWILGVVLGFYALMGLAGLGLAWRLSQGPLDAAPILPFVEKIMSQGERLNFDIGEMELSWQGGRNPVAVKMRDMRLLGPRGEFLSIGHADLGLSSWRLLLAQLHFSHAEIGNLSMRIIRLPDGHLTLTGAESEPGREKARSVVLYLDNIVNDLPSIGRLKLSDMRVVFEDQKEALIRRFDDVELEMEQKRGIGGRAVSGYLTSTLTGINDGSMAAVDFIYEPADKTLTASARLDKAGTRKLIGGFLSAANLPIVDMLVQGRAEIRLKNDFSLDFLSLQLQGDDGMLYWPRSYGAGLQNEKLTKFDLEIGFAPETRTLELENAAVTIKGITVNAKGALSADAGWDKMTGAIDVNIPVVAVDVLPAIWPKVWDSGGREWLVDNMDKGRFANIDVGIPLTVTRGIIVPGEDDIEIAIELGETELEPETYWDIETGAIRGTFDFTGVTVDYRAPLLPARNTTGTGVYEGLGLRLDIKKAHVGDLAITKGELYFDDLITAGKGHADLHFLMKGSVGSVFRYLEKEPIAYRKKVDLDVSAAGGTADLDVKIDFPTLADMAVEDVHVQARAKLRNLRVPGAVKGLTLAGSAFDLEASENHFKLEGTGTLEGEPATLSWHELFSAPPKAAFASKLEASIRTNKYIREKFIGQLENRVEGYIPADISLVTSPAGKGSLKVSANLADARIDFTDPFNAVKEKGAAASLNLTGTLQNGFIQSIDTLSVSGAGMSIASGSIAFGRDANNEPVLAKAVLNGLKLGENNADIEAQFPTETTIKASVTGASFDARNIMGGAEASSAEGNGEAPAGYDVTLKLDRLWLGSRPLETASGAFMADAGGILRVAQLDAAAGGTPVSLRYSATGEGDRLALDLADAGKGLAALGVTDRVRGGTLRVQAAPVPGGQIGDMKGKLVLKDFSVLKAPALAKLINLLSLPGILNLLEQDTGLRFTRAESEITWLNRKGGGIVVFKDGRTSGASLGLTFEGEINTAAGTIDMQGTAIPMSGVNSLVSNIPLIGDILTGGAKGSGIFAATYSIKGPTADPGVSVNPLSVLTPGILRRILFEGAPAAGSEPAP